MEDEEVPIPKDRSGVSESWRGQTLEQIKVSITIQSKLAFSLMYWKELHFFPLVD